MNKKLLKFLVIPLIGNLMGIFLFISPVQAAELSTINIINLTNKERIKAGLPEIKANSLLTKAAENKAEAIFDTQTFAHNLGSRKFSDWIKEEGYNYSYVGENLAMDFLTAEGAIRGWLDSPTHKKNLLNPEFEEIGVAVEEAQFENKKTILIVQIFGVQTTNNPRQTETTAKKETTLPKKTIVKDPMENGIPAIPENIEIGYRYSLNNNINYMSHSLRSADTDYFFTNDIVSEYNLNNLLIKPFISLMKNKRLLSKRG